MTSPQVSEQEVEAALLPIASAMFESYYSAIGNDKPNLLNEPASSIKLWKEDAYPVARAALTAAAQVRERAGDWRDISTAPKDEMFIWAAPKGEGKWSLGLAYRNVSGGWSDAYGSDAPARATYWKPIGQPPQLRATEPDFGPDVLGERKGEE